METYCEDLDMASKDTPECPICYSAIESDKNSVKTPCGHSFCYPCFVESIVTKSTCPICRRDLKVDRLRQQEVVVTRPPPPPHLVVNLIEPHHPPQQTRPTIATTPQSIYRAHNIIQPNHHVNHHVIPTPSFQAIQPPTPTPPQLSPVERLFPFFQSARITQKHLIYLLLDRYPENMTNRDKSLIRNKVTEVLFVADIRYYCSSLTHGRPQIHPLVIDQTIYEKTPIENLFPIFQREHITQKQLIYLLLDRYPSNMDNITKLIIRNKVINTVLSADRDYRSL